MTFNEQYSQNALIHAKSLRKNSTEFEQKLQYYLRGNRFLGLKFKRQVPLGNYIADFVCRDKKLIIELDGSGHLNEEQKIHDEVRDNYLRSLGYKIIRIYNNELDNMENVLEYIRINLPSP